MILRAGKASLFPPFAAVRKGGCVFDKISEGIFPPKPREFAPEKYRPAVRR